MGEGEDVLAYVPDRQIPCFADEDGLIELFEYLGKNRWVWRNPSPAWFGMVPMRRTRAGGQLHCGKLSIRT